MSNKLKIRYLALFSVLLVAVCLTACAAANPELGFSAGDVAELHIYSSDAEGQNGRCITQRHRIREAYSAIADFAVVQELPADWLPDTVGGPPVHILEFVLSSGETLVFDFIQEQEDGDRWLSYCTWALTRDGSGYPQWGRKAQVSHGGSLTEFFDSAPEELCRMEVREDPEDSCFNTLAWPWESTIWPPRQVAK